MTMQMVVMTMQMLVANMRNVVSHDYVSSRESDQSIQSSYIMRKRDREAEDEARGRRKNCRK